MNNELNINIVGKYGSGKTTIATLIANLLKNEGFNVNHIIDDQPAISQTEFNFNLNSIKNKKDYVITLTELTAVEDCILSNTKEIYPE